MKYLFLVLFLLAPFSAHAAIAFDNAAATADGAVTSRTLSYTVNSNTNGVMIVGTEGTTNASDNITGATECGIAMNLLDHYKGSSGRWIDLFYLTATGGECSGTNNVIVSGTPSDIIGFNVASYTGVNQSTPLDTLTGATGTNYNQQDESNTALTNTVTTTSANDWLVMTNHSATCTGASGTDVRASGLGNGYNLTDSNSALAAGSNSQGCTNSSLWSSIVVALKPVAAATVSSFGDLEFFGWW